MPDRSRSVPSSKFRNCKKPQVVLSGRECLLPPDNFTWDGLAAMNEKIYFESGISLHTLCAGDEVRLLRVLEEQFASKIAARDNQVDISGSDNAVQRTVEFFNALLKLYRLRNRQLEQRDVEMLCRMFRSGSGNELEELWKGRVTVSPKKRDILPRSRRQLEYINRIRSSDVVFGIGPAGTGKTYLAMALAVSEFLQNRVSRIILTRPARESGERLGFLPGSLEEKVSPYLRPLYDALYEMMTPEEAQTLIERQIIEIAPLAFMRGRTLNNAFIILDEAQNTTEDQMLMFLTRMGFGSKCVITGDPMQSDLARGERSGLEHAITTLRSLPELGFVFFDTADVVRHRLLEKIITAYTGENSCRDNGELR